MPLQAYDIDAALGLWNETEGAAAQLINYSENHTFLIDTAGQGRFTLRVHRPGYQSRPSIESELAWLTALRQATDLAIPEPVSGWNGSLLQAFRTAGGEDRLAVLFRFVAGVEPTLADDLTGLFGTLGTFAATMHRHVMEWERPPGFERQAWNAETVLSPEGLWGDWRRAPGVDPEIAIVLEELSQTLTARLGCYGTSRQRYGLVHADMRLGNILDDAGKITLIDFDDCGFCWYGYDFAASISFHETSPVIPALKSAWLSSYRAVRPFNEEDEAELESMVMLRRMALLAWIGSHAETTLAQSHMPGFAAGSADLARRYLAGSLWD
jgi:Ser/Thr protein kinase RdoA (MazF antagonist)